MYINNPGHMTKMAAIQGFANYQHATGPEGQLVSKSTGPEFSTGPTSILSRLKLFWIQRSPHCKTNIAQTNYDDCRLNSWP